MAKVLLTNWREGLEKIALTKLQVEKLGLSLKESKKNVDSLLEGTIIVLNIPETFLAVEFYHEAQKIGVDCQLITS